MNILGVAAAMMLAPSPTLLAGGQEAISFSAETAVAYGDDGLPMFRGNPDFIFDLAKNPGRRAFASSPDGRKVRITAPDQAGIFLRCDELKPLTAFCTATAAPRPPRARGATRGMPRLEPSAPLGRGIPSCPGDPRCPQIK